MLQLHNYALVLNDSDLAVWRHVAQFDLISLPILFIVVATRTSARVPRDGVPIAAKAAARTQKRDNDLQGMFASSFTVLNSAPNTYLKEVMGDLDIEGNDLDAQINIFKAEEIVRADLAKANYNAYLDKINKKNAPHLEEDIKDLAMSPIDNSSRYATPLDNGPPCGAANFLSKT